MVAVHLPYLCLACLTCHHDIEPLFKHRIFWRHAIKVLATLFLLAYANEFIITVLSYTSMVYLDHSLRFLWLYDGNIMALYFHDEHIYIPLALAAVMAFLLVVIPYTLTLIFGQCLQRSAYHRIVNSYIIIIITPVLVNNALGHRYPYLLPLFVHNLVSTYLAMPMHYIYVSLHGFACVRDLTAI